MVSVILNWKLRFWRQCPVMGQQWDGIPFVRTTNQNADPRLVTYRVWLCLLKEQNVCDYLQQGVTLPTLYHIPCLQRGWIAKLIIFQNIGVITSINLSKICRPLNVSSEFRWFALLPFRLYAFMKRHLLLNMEGEWFGILLQCAKNHQLYVTSVTVFSLQLAVMF